MNFCPMVLHNPLFVLIFGSMDTLQKLNSKFAFQWLFQLRVLCRLKHTHTQARCTYFCFPWDRWGSSWIGWGFGQWKAFVCFRLHIFIAVSFLPSIFQSTPPYQCYYTSTLLQPAVITTSVISFESVLMIFLFFFNRYTTVQIFLFFGNNLLQTTTSLLFRIFIINTIVGFMQIVSSSFIFTVIPKLLLFI